MPSGHELGTSERDEQRRRDAVVAHLGRGEPELEHLDRLVEVPCRRQRRPLLEPQRREVRALERLGSQRLFDDGERLLVLAALAMRGGETAPRADVAGRSRTSAYRRSASS